MMVYYILQYPDGSWVCYKNNDTAPTPTNDINQIHFWKVRRAAEKVAAKYGFKVFTVELTLEEVAFKLLRGDSI